MAVPRQLTQIAFAAGLDESTEDEVLDPTTGFAVLQNVRQDRRGGLSKRQGFSALSRTRSDATTMTEGRRCFAHRGSPCVVSGSGTVDVYDEGLANWVPTEGTASACSAEVIPLSASSVPIEATAQNDAVVCNDFLVIAYATYSQASAVNSGPTLMVQRASNPAIPINTLDLGYYGLQSPVFHLGKVGNTALLVVGTAGSGTIQLYKLDCTDTSTVAAGWAFVTNVATNRKPTSLVLSVCQLSSAIAVAYVNDAGGVAQITVKTVDSTGVLNSANVSTTAVTPDQAGIGSDGSSTLWVVWNESLAVKATGLDPSALTSVASTATVISGTGLMTTRPPIVLATASNACTVYADPSPAARLACVDLSHSGGAITVDDSSDSLGACMAGQPFVKNGRVYALVTAYDAVTDVSYSVALGDLTGRNDGGRISPHAYFAPGRVATDMTTQPVTLTDGRTAYLVAITTAATVRSYAMVAFDFTDRMRWQPSAHNGVTFLSGGVLTYLSTDRVQEASFLQTPRGLAATDTGSLTGPTGTVTYVAAFESVDGAGNLTISGVCDPVTVTTTGFSVDVECQPLLITSRGDARVAFYRTKANGKVYYRIGSAPAFLTGSGVTDIIDTYDDTTLESLPLLNGTGLLPGTGGAPLQREAPPYCSDVVSMSGMLVTSSGSDLWWSGQTIGGEGTWFSAEQFFTTVDGDGDLTSLAVQDGTLYAFKDRGIWAVAGEAPADNGSGGGLGTPRRISSDVGCTEATSVVTTALGTFFRSYRGIELLGRGGAPSWVGENVQSTLTEYPYITSAVLDERNNLVRFSLAVGIQSTGLTTNYSVDIEPPYTSSGGGRDIVYDLTLQLWQSVDDKHGSTNHQSSQDACVADVLGTTRYIWLATDGTVYYEADSYLDNSEWITMSAETGWFKAAGIQGRQQVNRLLTMARLRTGCDLSVSLGYDYGTDYATARTWTRAELDSLLASWPITQLRHDPNDNSEGMAVRVRIEDATPSSGDVDSGRGATWLALTLDITTKEGPADVPEEAT